MIFFSNFDNSFLLIYLFNLFILLFENFNLNSCHIIFFFLNDQN